MKTLLAFLVMVGMCVTPACAEDETFGDWLIAKFIESLPWDPYGDWEYDPDDYGDPCTWCDQPVEPVEIEGPTVDEDIAGWIFIPYNGALHYIPDEGPEKEEWDRRVKELSMTEREKLERDRKKAEEALPSWMRLPQVNVTDGCA